MDRNVTAVYRTYSGADTVRRELGNLGVSRSHVHVIPDTEQHVGAGQHRDDSRWMDELHDLYLPDEDLRTYQQCVRRGDYVVSANVDASSVQRVQEIMRSPESDAYDLDPRSAEFHEELVIRHSDTMRPEPDTRFVGQRDPENTDPYVRSYRRDSGL